MQPEIRLQHVIVFGICFFIFDMSMAVANYSLFTFTLAKLGYYRLVTSGGLLHLDTRCRTEWQVHIHT